MGQLRPDDAALLAQAGFSLGAYAAYFTALDLVGAFITIGVAGLIVWGRSRDWMALFVSMLLPTAATALPIVTVLETVPGGWASVIVGVLRALFASSMVPFFYLFPDGRFVPRRTAWLTIGWVSYTLAGLFFPALRPPVAFGRGLNSQEAPVILWIMLWFLSGILAQVWRYRRVSDAIQRQRTKWVVVGLVSLVILFVAGVLTLTSESFAESGAVFVAARLIGPTLILLGFMTAALSIGLSALRYRLWDVDIIIRRTLIYTLLTGLLALMYFSSVVLLQSLFRLIAGQAESPLVTVLSTLAIAVLFGLVRRGVQNFIDRRFYRQKYDAAKTLADFAATARDETNLDRLTARLVEVVNETMQPESVSLWLKPTKDDRRKMEA